MNEEPNLETQRNDELHGVWVVLFWMLAVGTLGGCAVYFAEPSSASEWIGGAWALQLVLGSAGMRASRFPCPAC